MHHSWRVREQHKILYEATQNPYAATQIPYPATQIPYAATKTQHRQINKYIKKTTPLRN